MFTPETGRACPGQSRGGLFKPRAQPSANEPKGPRRVQIGWYHTTQRRMRHQSGDTIPNELTLSLAAGRAATGLASVSELSSLRGSSAEVLGFC